MAQTQDHQGHDHVHDHGRRLFDNITLPASADFHVHLRQASLMHAVVPTLGLGGVDTVYVMPNLNPPVDTVAAALAYKAELEKIVSTTTSPGAGADTKFLMTLYLNDKITPEVIHQAKASGAIAGVKSYPRGVTTGSDGGVKGVDYSPYYPVFAAMEETGLVLNLHGECPFSDDDDGEDGDDDDDEKHGKEENAKVDVLNAEEKFLPTLREVVRRFPKLKVVLEHVTSRAAVEFVRDLRKSGFDNVRGTITAHHLWLTVDDWAGDGLNFCKPVAKREADRRALIRAGVYGDGLFFLGSDSAPHLLSGKKGKGLSKCAAGVFTQANVTQLVLEAWEEGVRKGLLQAEHVKKQDVLQGFLGVWGRKFYGVDESKRRIRIKAGNETVQEILEVEGENKNNGVVPFWSGKNIYSIEWL